MAATTVKLPVLSAAATDAFDQYLAATQKQRQADSKGRKAKSDKSAAHKLITGEMGEAKTAKLLDGRIIMREQNERNMPAKPAHKQEWETLKELSL